MHNIEKNNHTKTQGTWKFKKTEPDQNFNFEKFLIVVESWLMGAMNSHFCITICKITEEILSLLTLKLLIMKTRLRILKFSEK